MQNDPLISVVVPVYNTGKYLEECLQSIIEQSYQNLEIVVLDNGSTDNSNDIINEFAGKDARLKVLHIAHVDTVTESRNNAFLRASSQWIIPIDSDDYIEKDYVKKLWQRHVETGADYVGSCMIHFNNENRDILYTIPDESFDTEKVYTGKEAVAETIGTWRWRISGNGPLLNKDIIPCIKNNSAVPVFNDEYNTREMYINSGQVAIVKAQYFYRMNLESTGKKISFARLMYAPVTHLGLIQLIEKEFAVDSVVYKKESAFSRNILSGSRRLYLQTKSVLNKEERKQYKSTINKLYRLTNLPKESFKDYLKNIYIRIVVFRLQLS